MYDMDKIVIDINKDIKSNISTVRENNDEKMYIDIFLVNPGCDLNARREI